MRVLISFTIFFRNISHSKKKWTIYDQKCILTLTQSASYCCHILMKLKSSRRTFEKFSNTEFHDNPSSGNRSVPGGRAAGRTEEANSRFSQFCERAYEKPKGMTKMTVEIFKTWCHGDFLCKRFIDHVLGRSETHFHQFKYRKLCCHTRSLDNLSFDFISLQQHFNSTDTASSTFNKRPQIRIVLGLPDFQDALSGSY